MGILRELPNEQDDSSLYLLPRMGRISLKRGMKSGADGKWCHCVKAIHLRFRFLRGMVSW
jgi:hypothetical protein